MIIEFGNVVYLCFMGAVLLAAVLVGLCFRNASEKAKTVFIVALCAANVVIFWIYKGALSVDRQYLEAAGLDRFNWFDELPLHLCNINMFLIPLGVLTKKRGLMGFSFILAPLGAVMAMVFPDPKFTGYSLLMPRIMGYYVTHGLIIVAGISLATLGFFRPKFRDFPKVALSLVAISLGAHVINTLFRITGLCTYANYFYTYGADISILSLFMSWIPVPYLYLVPSFAILGVYMTLVCLLFMLLDRKKKPQ